MKRWNLATGVTLIFILLLVVSGYAVVSVQSIARELDQLISGNYDSIRLVRKVRDSMTRINSNYRGASAPTEIPESQTLFRQERVVIVESLSALQDGVGRGPDRDHFDRMAAYLREYLEVYPDYLKLPRNRDPRTIESFDYFAERIATLTGNVAEAAGLVVDDNEREIFARREQALTRAHRAQDITLVLAAGAVLIYLVATMRIAREIYRPLRELRDAIVELRDGKLDLRLKLSGSEEVNQISTAFNEMAVEMKRMVTEREARANQTSQDYQGVLAALPYPVYILNEDQTLRNQNEAAQRLNQELGVDREAPAAVRRQVDLSSGSQQPLLDQDIKRTVELRRRGDDGVEAVHWYLPQVFPLRSAEQGRQGWAVLLVDVTKIRRLDEARQKALSTLGHEIKTPVTGIRMTLHLLLEQKIGPLNADQKELLQGSRDDCERLLAVLHSLMELARLEGGRTPFKLQPITPQVILQQSVGIYSTLAKAKGCTLVTDERIDPSIKVWADPIHAERVLGNFISNAVKYGVPSSHIRIGLSARNDGYVRFSVINEAKQALSEAEAEKIFQPFYRRPGEQAEGAGLGLTIAKEIATLHGGKIGVWPQGREIEFFLDLRVANSHQNDPQPL